MAKQKVVSGDHLGHVKDERRLLLSLDHPFIVKLFGAFQDRDSVYLLTEVAVIAAELWSVLYEGTAGYKTGRLPIGHGIFYAACLLDALIFMHGKGIAHRDLKPENIMVDEKGYVRIVDLGFAKHIPFLVHVWGKTEIHPKSYTICGTPEYLAPELIVNSGHTKAADIWAFGVVIYELTAGHTPFQVGMYGLEEHAALSTCCCSDFDQKTAAHPTRDLIHKLLRWEPGQRLGKLQADMDAIRRHAHFADTDWAALADAALAAPWVPPAGGARRADKVDKGAHRKVPPFTGKQSAFADW
ncbi:kinase-like domain-containing protein [Tribonema minus]|uniref:Kinase-like domain-containing protein n=1 Tax=Tribonema minus TaxID=303371 RepID=A0A835YXU3_9STRA|nr:kinase-like domain-containing protein [Tribonema minus]